jgi:hypothetical protein
MTWTKTPDDYPDRLLDLSDAAYRLHHAATVYANRVGLDGRLTDARVSLVPVPLRSRRNSVIRELEAAGLWERDGGEWVLTDFFEAQLSAEEVRCRREYDAIRQRIRFATSSAHKAELRALEDAAKAALNVARERRRGRADEAITEATALPTSHRESHGDSHRPAPIRPAPSRSSTRARDENGTGTPSFAPVGSDECARCHQPFGLVETRTMVPRVGEVHAECPTVTAA